MEGGVTVIQTCMLMNAARKPFQSDSAYIFCLNDI